MQKACKNCEKDFEAKRSTAQFCSDLCRVTFNRKKDAAEEQRKERNARMEIVQGKKEFEALASTIFPEIPIVREIPVTYQGAADALVKKSFQDYLREAPTVKHPMDFVRQVLADKSLTPGQRDMIRAKIIPEKLK